MKTKALLILLICSIIFAQDDEVGFRNSFGYRIGFSKTGSQWTPQLPGITASQITPYSGVYLRFLSPTASFGNFVKVISSPSSQRGLHLLSGDFDKFWMDFYFKYIFDPVSNHAFVLMGTNSGTTGWEINFYVDFANKLNVRHGGVSFQAWDMVAPVTDTAFHNYELIYSTSDSTYRSYRNDTAKYTLKAVPNCTDTATGLMFGSASSTFTISDTDAVKPAAFGNSMNGALYGFCLVKRRLARDTAWYYPLNEGYGDFTYCTVLTADTSLNAFARPRTIANAISRGASVVISYMDADRAPYTAPGTSGNLVGMLGGFPSLFDRYNPQWWFLSPHRKITNADKPAIIDTMGGSGFSGISNFSFDPGLAIGVEAYAIGGTLFRDSFVVISDLVNNNVNIPNVNSFGDTSFHVHAYNVNQKAWQNIFSNTNYPLMGLYSVVQYNGDLIAGGGLTTLGDSIKGVARTRNIARRDYDSSAWKSIDSGFNDGVTIVKAFGNALFAGGAFTASGNTSGFGKIAIMRTPYGEWEKLGTGISGGVVWGIDVNGSDTVIGGSFNSFNGVSASNICKWNGTTAVAMGSGLDGAVYVPLNYKGSWWAGGNFTGGISKFNGTSWAVQFGGLSWSTAGEVSIVDIDIGRVKSAGVQVDSVIVACGSFTRVGTDTVGRSFIYNGFDITPLPWITERPEEVICYNKTGSDTLYIVIAGDQYGIYGASTQCSAIIKVTFSQGSGSAPPYTRVKNITVERL